MPPHYLHFVESKDVLWLVGAVLTLILAGRLAVLHRRYSIPVPLPPPSRWPSPLPIGWWSFIATQAMLLFGAGAAVMFAGYHYFEQIGELEARGGKIMLWQGFAMAYDAAGRAGLLGLAVLIGIVFWGSAGYMAWKGWTANRSG